MGERKTLPLAPAVWNEMTWNNTHILLTLYKREDQIIFDQNSARDFPFIFHSCSPSIFFFTHSLVSFSSLFLSLTLYLYHYHKSMIQVNTDVKCGEREPLAQARQLWNITIVLYRIFTHFGTSNNSNIQSNLRDSLLGHYFHSLYDYIYHHYQQ